MAEMTTSDSWSDSMSTSPSTSPSAALSACPRLERSASGTSSFTSVSNASTSVQSKENVASKRRGYTRPQGTAFADSARSRDSVMSLGTIAHLQHYFARTGLLDGKGAQFAKEDQQKRNNSEPPEDGSSQALSALDSPMDQSLNQSSLQVFDKPDSADTSFSDDISYVNSPEQVPTEMVGDEPNSLSLAPTVSTYKHKTVYVPPPPNLAVLRRELREALDDVKKLLIELQTDQDERTAEKQSIDTPTDTSADGQGLQGWHELQGLQVLDLVTLAIKAARNFYTSHEHPRRLYSITSDRKMRSDLFTVMETLKKLAARNFAGGVRNAERQIVSGWVSKIEEIASKDEELESHEHEKREKWRWLDGDWTGKEREREWLFLKSFDTDPDNLPEWTEPSVEDPAPTNFLRVFQNGLRLVHLHNELDRSSTRHFEEIKVYHTDTAKPYRCAENLRYWTKAAELRWDVILEMDVHGVVHGESASAWQTFDKAILKWCKAVREELTKDWREHRETMKMEKPIVRMNGDGMDFPW
ncbi:MAG: hypothetical protein M1831_005546 [Alyxoria varia]|nr:MAG: hypothetical protein M1831_005546 [Alyxoria varia]